MGVALVREEGHPRHACRLADEVDGVQRTLGRRLHGPLKVGADALAWRCRAVCCFLGDGRSRHLAQHAAVAHVLLLAVDADHALARARRRLQLRERDVAHAAVPQLRLTRGGGVGARALVQDEQPVAARGGGDALAAGVVDEHAAVLLAELEAVVVERRRGE